MDGKFMFSLFLLSFVITFSSENILSDRDDEKELRIYRFRVSIIDDLLKHECPNYNSKREVLEQNHFSTKVEVEKRLYETLIAQLDECRAKRSSRNPSTTKRADEITTRCTATSTMVPGYRDCQDYYRHGYSVSGVYQLTPVNHKLPAFDVWCDFFNNSGWTVIQRRSNSSFTSFNRTWNQYKRGFGNIAESHWLGNDKINFLTKANQKLNVQLETKSGGEVSLYWKRFYVAGEVENYTLTIDKNGYSGELIDRFSAHNKVPFSTIDVDNDNWSTDSCARISGGGWWYDNCVSADLNREDRFRIYLVGYSYPMRSSVMRVTRHQ